MSIGQQASTWPDLIKIQKQGGTISFIVQHIDDDAGTEQKNGHVSGQFLFEAVVVFATEAFHPFGGAPFELRVVPILPPRRGNLWVTASVSLLVRNRRNLLQVDSKDVC